MPVEHYLVVMQNNFWRHDLMVFDVLRGLGAAKVSLATVYQKHSSLRTHKRMYRG